MTAQGTINRHNDDQGHLLDRGADPNEPHELHRVAGGRGRSRPLPRLVPAVERQRGQRRRDADGADARHRHDRCSAATSSSWSSGFTSSGAASSRSSRPGTASSSSPTPTPRSAYDKTGQFAQWVGVDTTILAQRADFLRPDSLVAILVLTDENDSEVDVRAFGGTAWNFMSTNFNPPRGTSVCATNPGDPGCTSCAFGKNGNDSECTNEGGFYTAMNDTHNWGYDLNLRHVHEKQKYGVSVQFPIQRYVLGLTSPRVPNRDTEYPAGAPELPGRPRAAALTCVNPLYAAKLPTAPAGSSNWNPTADELCNLTPGTRKPGLVYYAHIGGVPHQLLQTDPSNPDSPQKDTLTEADWQLILGKDPENFDYTGIDPHMVESYQPRTSVPVPPNGFKVADQSQPEGTDPISGREWTTDSTMAEHTGLLVDREYACIFKLRYAAGLLDGGDHGRPDPPRLVRLPAPGQGRRLHATRRSPRSATTPRRPSRTPRRRIRRSASSSWRTSSEPCPAPTWASSRRSARFTRRRCGTGDPLYGYRPAMNAIITALSKSLSHQCLPQRLTIDPTTKTVPCLVLGTFPSGPGTPTSCSGPDPRAAPTRTPDPTVLKEFRNDQHAAYVQGGSVGDDPSTQLTCQLKQLPPNVPCDSG